MRLLFLSMAGFGVIMGMLLASPSSAFAKVNVFTCSPEWAALAEEIGGELVDVTSATTAQQDIHHLRAKPSLLAAMRKADLVFCTGASLEIGWLPILLKKAGGPNVQLETVGSIMASDYVEKLEIMKNADRSMGHVHPEGNPHIHLNPANIEKVAAILTDRLLTIDSAHTTKYSQNLDRFKQKWSTAMQRWNTEKGSLQGKKVVVYHNSWVYLLKWLGIEAIATLEPKPGLPPTASHLEDILKTVQGKNVTAILIAPFENEDAARWLNQQTGIPIIRLPFTVGGNESANTLISLFDDTLKRLKEAP